MASVLAAALQLMLVTDDRYGNDRDLVDLCRAAVRGGITSIELRLKLPTTAELLSTARALIAAVPVPVLVNDRLDVALAAGAAGVHLGPDDLPVRLARKAAPPGFLIGASVGAIAELGFGQGADYWGVGPWRITSTKPDAGPSIGSGGFAAVVAAAGGIPCIAIGGIRPEDVVEVRRLGGAGIAVSSGILGVEAVELAARRYGTAVVQ